MILFPVSDKNTRRTPAILLVASCVEKFGGSVDLKIFSFLVLFLRHDLGCIVVFLFFIQSTASQNTLRESRVLVKVIKANGLMNRDFGK